MLASGRCLVAIVLQDGPLSVVNTTVVPLGVPVPLAPFLSRRRLGLELLGMGENFGRSRTTPRKTPLDRLGTFTSMVMGVGVEWISRSLPLVGKVLAGSWSMVPLYLGGRSHLNLAIAFGPRNRECWVGGCLFLARTETLS